MQFEVQKTFTAFSVFSYRCIEGPNIFYLRKNWICSHFNYQPTNAFT